MTTTHTTSSSYRNLFAALDLLPPLLAKATTHLDNPTPCTDFTVGDLLAHLQVVIRRIDALGHGLPAESVPIDSPPEPDTAQVWARYATSAKQAWATLPPERVLVVPWGENPASAIAETYAAETILHSWDLARATHQNFAIHDGLAADALATYKHVLPVADRDELFEQIFADLPENAPRKRPFGNAMPDGHLTTTIDQLVAWSGRDPKWSQG